jgi:predicted permease
LAGQSLSEQLQEGGRGGIGGQGVSRLRGALVVAEVAMSVILLVGAGLLIQSFRKLMDVKPGFDPSNVLAMNLSLSSERYRQPEARVAFFKDAVERVSGRPGVESAAYVMFPPFSGPGSATSFEVIGRPKPAPGRFPVCDVRVAHPNYFRTVRIPLLRGRVFDDGDLRMEAPMRFVVNETMARQMFPDQEALGQKLSVSMGDPTPGEIIGVVGDVKHASLQEQVRPMVYYPHSRLAFPFTTLLVKSALPESAILPEVARTLRQMDPELPVFEVKPLASYMRDSVERPKVQMALLGVLSGVALALAAVGIYGLMAFLASLRVREIGVRMALGATPKQMLGMMLWRGLGLTLWGLAAGIAGALALTRVLRTLLYAVETTDPATYAVVGAVLLVAALAACYLPARQAAMVDPITALRQE